MAKRYSNPSTHATGQLTLFDCEAKKRRLNLSRSTESDHCADVEVPDNVSSAQAQAQQTERSDTETVQNPSGAINADSDSVPTSTIEEVSTTCIATTQSLESFNVPGTSHEQHFAHAPNLPSDISSGPSDKPVQPNRATARFSPTVWETRRDPLTQNGFKHIHG